MAREVTPEEMVDEWAKIIQKAKPGAKGAADAMAKYIAWRAEHITLRRTTHAPGAYHRQRPGEPPAYGSGTLAESMYAKPAYTGVRATALVGNKVPYSRIAEFGCVITPTNKKFLHWVDSAGSWYHKSLVYREHPFLEPTVDEAIDDGSLQEAAIDGFQPFDP